MTDPAPETIAHLRELDAARTPGEWSVRSGDGWVYVAGPEVTVDSDYAPDAEFIAAAANAMPGLLAAAEESAGHRRQADYHIGRANRAEQALGAVNAEVTRLRADLAEARGDSPAGFMSQREWEDWSNELAMLIPEDDMHGNPEGAQESIILATLSGWYGELVEARAVIEQIESLAKIQAISCQAAHRADHARNWLDVLAIIERSALAPATQREEGV